MIQKPFQNGKSFPTMT